MLYNSCCYNNGITATSKCFIIKKIARLLIVLIGQGQNAENNITKTRNFKLNR